MQNRLVLWLCLIIFPPAGLILVWIRKHSRLSSRLLLSFAAILFGILHLYFFWHLRLELNGGMSRPFLSFSNPERHNAAVEKLQREEHAVDTSHLPITAPKPTASPSEAREPVAEPEINPTASSIYWSEFRGPGRRGEYDETEIITDWPSGKLPLLWKRPVGGGYASMVVARGTIFTIEQRRKKEAVVAYDLESGKQKWIHAWDAEFRETLGGDGPRATPTWYDGRLYALGALGEFRCLDARSGKLVWSRNILSDNEAANLEWGMAASPLIVDDKVIVLPGGPNGKSVVAYDRLTGNPIWKALDDRQAYVAPQLAVLSGRRQILVVSATHVVGLAPEDGSLLWQYPWAPYQGISAAQPLVTAANRFFISAGYDQGAALVEISSLGNPFEARTIWRNKRMKNKFSGSVIHDGYIYGLDEGIFACIDAATGELKWKGGRYGHGQVLLASGHLIISGENGEVILVKADPEGHHELARFPAVSGKTWNVPAIADGKLIVRNQTEMACFRIAK
jgi:outer membrane protein assembly factor BamB